MGLKDKVVRALALRWLRGKIKDLRGKERESAMGKVLKFLDGYKLLIGVFALAGVKAWDMANNGHAGDYLGIVLQLLGYTPGAEWNDLIANMGASLLVIVGSVHKIIKATQQVRAGSSIAGSLSTEGYVQKYISDAIKEEQQKAPKP